MIQHVCDGPVAFEPIDKPQAIDIYSRSDADETGLKAVALAVVNPPADGLLTKGGKGRNQLIYREDVFAIHEQTLSSFNITVSHSYGRWLKSGVWRV